MNTRKPRLYTLRENYSSIQVLYVLKAKVHSNVKDAKYQKPFLQNSQPPWDSLIARPCYSLSATFSLNHKLHFARSWCILNKKEKQYLGIKTCFEFLSPLQSYCAHAVGKLNFLSLGEFKVIYVSQVL